MPPTSLKKGAKVKLPFRRKDYTIRFAFGSGTNKGKLLTDREIKALYVPETGGKTLCAMYVRLAAERLFGLKYAPERADRFGNVNHVVWDELSKTELPVLKPGQIIGMFYPESNYNQQDWRFTHAALVVKPHNGDYVIAHNIGVFFRIDLLSEFINHSHSRPVQVIQPKDFSTPVSGTGAFARHDVGGT